MRTTRAGVIGIGLLAACFAASCGSSSSRGGFVATTTAAATSSSAGPGPASAPAPTPVTPAPSGTSQWPIVLIHGIGGFRRIGTLDYFVGVEQRLRSLGFQVHAVQVPPVAGIEVRAAALAAEVRQRFPDPLQKVNLVAHSMGGLDARAAIARHGLAGKVASLSMLSTPNRGSAVADVAVGLTPGNIQQSVDSLLNVVGLDWDGVLDLTSARTAAFNAITPDDPAVFYQSWGARSDPFGQSGTRMQPVLWPSWGIAFAIQGPNDGLVAPGSATWGTWNGVLPADHASEVGLFGQVTFDHLRFFEQLALDLVARGF